VAVRGGRVILEVPPALLRLAQRMKGAAQVFESGAAAPEADLHCPLMSLPRAFGTTVATIPGKMPYLAADLGQVAAWRRRVANLEGMRVGLVWASGLRPDHPETELTRRRKSITLGHFANLVDVAAVSFVSLQKGEAAAQTRSPPPGLLVHDWTA